MINMDQKEDCKDNNSLSNSLPGSLSVDIQQNDKNYLSVPQSQPDLDQIRHTSSNASSAALSEQTQLSSIDTVAGLLSKTPEPASITTLKSTFSHVNHCFHDVVFDVLVHEFDEETLQSSNLTDQRESVSASKSRINRKRIRSCESDKSSSAKSVSESVNHSASISSNSKNLSKDSNHNIQDIDKINPIYLPNGEKSSELIPFKRPSNKNRKSRDINTIDEDAVYFNKKNPKLRLEMLKYFQTYLKFRDILCIISIITISIYQFVYFIHYWVSGIFGICTCILYLLLFIPRFNKIVSLNYYCSYFLILIRLFHTFSLITLLNGVAQCQFQYNVKKQLIKNKSSFYLQLNQYILSLEKGLYIIVSTAIVSLNVMDYFTVIDDKFIVNKWKGLHWFKFKYYITKHGEWRNDMKPISYWDRCCVFALFSSTFISIIISSICITKMELVIELHV